jgi:polyhydroxyalkanoate synthesis regulator phasin
MERKEPKLVDMRSIIQRLEALENRGASANSQGDLQELDERVSELERRVDELTDLVTKLKAVLTI